MTCVFDLDPSDKARRDRLQAAFQVGENASVSACECISMRVRGKFSDWAWPFLQEWDEAALP